MAKRNREVSAYVLSGAAVLTWALVGYVGWLEFKPGTTLVQPLLCLLAYGAYGLAMLRCLVISEVSLPRPTLRVLLAVQFVAAFLVLLLMGNDIALVLVIVAASQLPWSLNWPQSVVVLLIFNSAQFVVRVGERPLTALIITSLLYFSFQIFAYLSTLTMLREREGREQLTQTLAELHAAQHLLDNAARQNERVQIARALHDMLGHHLTALSIQLQIAGHVSEGAALEQIQKAQQLAKLLLADVREAVSELREHQNIDVLAALRELVQGVPRLQVELSVPDELALTDLAQADAIVRTVQEALTNSLRHSGAAGLWIRLHPQGKTLQVQIHDDGQVAENWQVGNGLRGMRERIDAAGGALELNRNAAGALAIDVQFCERHV